MELIQMKGVKNKMKKVKDKETGERILVEKECESMTRGIRSYAGYVIRMKIRWNKYLFGLTL